MTQKPASGRPSDADVLPHDVTSPADSLVEQVRSALALRRRDALQHVQAIQAALTAYQRAVEERIVAEFVRDHQLRQPKLTGLSPETAAQRLRELVLSLPELPAPAAAERVQTSLNQPPPSQPPQSQGSPPHTESTPPLSTDLPRLLTLSADGKLVVVGALAGRRRAEAIPLQLRPQTEWVDTDSGGVHAIGNLPQRIRQGRVTALIILDQAVQHKHTEPLVSAARTMGIPVGFAGKGGGAAMKRALENIEEQLSTRKR